MDREQKHPGPLAVALLVHITRNGAVDLMEKPDVTEVHDATISTLRSSPSMARYNPPRIIDHTQYTPRHLLAVA